MYEIKQFADQGLVVVTYGEPFSVSDLMRVAEALGVPGLGKDQHRALLIDLRKVEVTGVSGSDSRKFIEVRKARAPGIPAELTCHGSFIQPRPETGGHLRLLGLVQQSPAARIFDRVQREG